MGVGVHHGVTFITSALPKCVHLPYFRHVSRMTTIYGVVQLIIVYNSCMSFYIIVLFPLTAILQLIIFLNFTVFSLLINAVILLLNCFCFNTLSLHTFSLS